MPTYSIRAPNGKTYTVTGPAGATQAQVQAEVLRQHPDAGRGDTRPKSFWRGFVDELGKAGANAAALQERIDPVLQIPALLADLTGHGDLKLSSRMDRTNAVLSRGSKYQGSTAGRIAGGVVGTLPTMAIPGVGAVAGRAAPFLNAAIQGGASGMLLSDKRDAKSLAENAATGALGGVGGHVIGSKLVAPVAARVAATAPAQKAIGALAEAANAFGASIKRASIPRISPAEKTAGPALTAARQNIEDAARLGLPYAPADAAPQLRSLAGSVARFSPDAQAQAEAAFGPRALQTRARAVNAMDQHLAPITDISQRSAQLKQAAWDKADPLYREAFAQPAPVSVELAAMLQSPAGKSALAEAHNIMLNSGKDPNMLGLGVNDTGDVVLTAHPTVETLDFVKKGLDSVLAGKRNAFGKLDLEGDPAAQSVNSLLGRFKSTMDQISPEYAAARGAYADAIQPRTALQTGFNTLPKANLPARDAARIIDSIAPDNLPEAARGYVTARADEVSRMAQGDPYKAVYGSMDEQAKLQSLFPQEGVANFERMGQLEKDMAKTYQEVLGGSATQPRAVADAQFAGMTPDMIAAGVDLAGGGGAASLANLARRGIASKVADRYRLGGFGAKEKADQLAPILFNTDPKAALAALTEIARKQAELQARKEAYQRASGIFGAPAGAAIAIGSQR